MKILKTNIFNDVSYTKIFSYVIKIRLQVWISGVLLDQSHLNLLLASVLRKVYSQTVS